MRVRIWLLLVPLVLLVGCSAGRSASSADGSASTSATSAETSAGANMPSDDAAFPGAAADGNTPADVLTAYIRAWNRSDWKTVYSLTAPPKAAFSSWTKDLSEDAMPYDDFKIHETRIVEKNRALVRVTYATIGFSSLEGLKPEERRTVVVVREPGEWWVLEKADTDDAVWRITPKGSLD